MTIKVVRSDHEFAGQDRPRRRVQGSLSGSSRSRRAHRRAARRDETGAARREARSGGTPGALQSSWERDLPRRHRGADPRLVERRVVTVVLDTHAWLWWTSQPATLGRRAATRIRAARRICVSAVSCLEVAIAAARGKISLDRAPQDWLEEALAVPR